MNTGTQPTEVSPNHTNMIRVVLADDHAVVRAGIRHLLKKTRDILIVGEAENGLQALKMITDLQPEVVLLDMEMPGLNGVEVTRHLQEARSPSKILVLSAYEDRQYILEVLENGASGYLTKDEVPEFIVDAIHQVSRGEQGWLSPRIANQMSNYEDQEQRRERIFSKTEKAILSYLNNSWDEKRIAAEMGLQPRTVHRLVESMTRKVGASSQRELVHAARRRGML